MSLSACLYEDEATNVERMLDTLSWDDDRAKRVEARAIELVERVRKAKRKPGELESFLQQFGLQSEEGLALMTLAEALLRIPDSHRRGWHAWGSQSVFARSRSACRRRRHLGRWATVPSGVRTPSRRGRVW